MTHPVTSSEITKTTPHIFEGLSREIFDGQDDIVYHTMALAGINETVVRQISKNGNEPDWML